MSCRDEYSKSKCCRSGLRGPRQHSEPMDNRDDDKASRIMMFIDIKAIFNDNTGVQEHKKGPNDGIHRRLDPW